MVIISRYLPARPKRTVIAPRFFGTVEESQTVVGNWMRHSLYRDALRLRLHLGKSEARPPTRAGWLTSIGRTERACSRKS